MKSSVFCLLVILVTIIYVEADDSDWFRSRNRRPHGDVEQWGRGMGDRMNIRRWHDDNDDDDFFDNFDIDIDDDDDDWDDDFNVRTRDRSLSGRVTVRPSYRRAQKHDHDVKVRRWDGHRQRGNRNRGRHHDRRDDDSWESKSQESRSHEKGRPGRGSRSRWSEIMHGDHRHRGGAVSLQNNEDKAASGIMIGKKDLTEYLPDIDWATPWMQGHLQVGPSISMSWDLGDIFGERSEMWWEGPNVCSLNEESENQLESPDIRTHHSSASTLCDETDTTYKCTTTVAIHGKEKIYTTKFECCHGFTREQGRSGCTEKLVLSDLLTTAENLNLTQLAKAVTSVGLETLLKNGNFTIFAPSDEAFVKAFPQLGDYEANQLSVVEVSAESMTMVLQLENVLAAHVVEGFYKSHDLDDGMLMTTANPNAKIRINKYEIPKRLITANCQPITSSDNLALNGVIHKIDGILVPVELTLLDIISKDDQLSTLKTVLAKTGLSRELAVSAGEYTLFAPTNDAFSKMDPSKLDKLLASENCLRNVLKHHLLPHIICSGVIQGRVRTFNTLKNFLHFNSTKDNQVFVEQAQVLRPDVMATNGVLHIIDDVLIPDDALDLFDVADNAGATQFIQLLKTAGLTKQLQQLDNVTLLLPTNEALQKLSNDTLLKLGKDPEALSKVLKYHVITEEVFGQHLTDQRKLDTLDSNKKVLIRDFSSFPFSVDNVKTAQCSPITKTDLQSCNGRIHLVDKVLLPPIGDVLDVLSHDSRFSKLMDLLKKSGIAEELQLSGPFTFFAPTNEAFEKVNAEILQRLAQPSEKEKLKQLLKHHIMHDSLCCSGVFETRFMWTPRERMLDGSTVLVSRRKEEVLINSIEIKTCDMTANNGVVHAIDDIIPDAVEKYAGSRQHNHRGRSQHRGSGGHGSHHARRGSRLSDIFGKINRHVSVNIGRRLDDIEWEFEWPDWMKDASFLDK